VLTLFSTEICQTSFKVLHHILICILQRSLEALFL